MSGSPADEGATGASDGVGQQLQARIEESLGKTNGSNGMAPLQVSNGGSRRNSSGRRTHSLGSKPRRGSTGRRNSRGSRTGSRRNSQTSSAKQTPVEVSLNDVWELIDGRVVQVKWLGSPSPPFTKVRNKPFHARLEDRFWIGLEVLSGGEGRNDGTAPNGKKYFDCEDGKGIFMRQTKFQELISRKQASDPNVTQTTQLPSRQVPKSTHSRSNSRSSIPAGRSPYGRRSRSHSPGRRRSTGMWKLVGNDDYAATSRATTGSKSNQRDLFNQHREQRLRQASVTLKKTGPRDYRRTGGNTMELASERMGIQPATASEFVPDYLKPRITQSSLQGFTASTIGGQSGLPISDKKRGPIEIGRHHGACLESIRAGISPMKYSEIQWDTDFASRAPGAMPESHAPPKSATDGFTATTSAGGSGMPIDSKKAGPIEIGRFRGACLASIKAGIAPMRQSEVNWDPNFAQRRPGAAADTHGPTKSALAGFTSSQAAGQSGLPINSGGHKAGPIEIGRHKGNAGLASVAAGIAPFSYNEAQWDPDFAKRTPSSLPGSHAPPKAALQGFTSSTAPGQSGLPIDSKKAGPIEIGRFHGAALASIQAGIMPHSNAEASWDPNFAKRDPSSRAGSHGPSKAALQGFTASTVSGQSGLPIDSKKAGPIEIGRNRTPLASQQAGIAPFKYSEANWDPKFFQRTPGAQAGARRVSGKTMSFSVSGVKNQSGMPVDQIPKPGPIQIGRNREKLASQQAGIAPATASDFVADPNFAGRHPGAMPDRRRSKAATRGFSTMKSNNQSGMPVGNGRKEGPGEIGRSAPLSSERAGITPARPRDHGSPDFDKPKMTQSALKGFTVTDHKTANAGSKAAVRMLR